MILRTEDWDRRRTLCKLYGYRYATIYEQRPGQSACYNRIRTKQWAWKKLGAPAYMNPEGQYGNTSADWFCGRINNEYVIAFRQRSHRDFALVL